MKPDDLPIATCKSCQREFVRRNSMQSVCSPRCAARLIKESHKAERQETKRRTEAIKPRSQWLKEAQTEVNKYVRLRDAHLGCVSCDKPASWQGQWHASHFRSVGAASAVRFNLWNIHKSCSVCNNWKSGNLSEYEPRLRARIGDAKVDALRAMNWIEYYSVEYLRRLKELFRRKTSRLDRKNDKHI